MGIPSASYILNFLMIYNNIQSLRIRAMPRTELERRYDELVIHLTTQSSPSGVLKKVKSLTTIITISILIIILNT